jgi:phenylacetate-CoA ligase
VSHYLTAEQQAELEVQYPSGQDFLPRYLGMSRDELRDLQEKRFRETVATAWRTGFYQRAWGAVGAEPGDIKGLDDLPGLPLIDKQTIMEDLAVAPPFGTLASSGPEGATAQVLQTTSGTTGDPQPVLWGAWGREVQNALLGRTYSWLGVGAGDVVQSIYGHGPVNGGHYIREAVARYTDALLLSAGTGLETRSEQQVAMMRRFRSTVLVGFADYLRKLADVAAHNGIDVQHDLSVRLIIGHLPAGSRESLEAAWPGARAFDWYGVADTGVVTAEGPDRDGQWVWEDANVVEITDTDTGAPVADGEPGNLVVTSLGKSDVAPLIRFNTHDVTRILPGTGAVDLPFRRTAGLLGRSDQMVKLRGINVYPTAIAALIADVPGATGEYYCRLQRRDDGADDLVVVIESRGHTRVDDTEQTLSSMLGVKISVEVVGEGETAPMTEILSRQKPRRLVDVR